MLTAEELMLNKRIRLISIILFCFFILILGGYIFWEKKQDYLNETREIRIYSLNKNFIIPYLEGKKDLAELEEQFNKEEDLYVDANFVNEVLNLNVKLFEEKKFTQIINIAEKILAKNKSNNHLIQLLVYQVIAAYEELDQWGKINNLLGNQEIFLLKDYYYYQMVRVLKKLNQEEEALKYSYKLQGEYPESSWTKLLSL